MHAAPPSPTLAHHVHFPPPNKEAVELGPDDTASDDSVPTLNMLHTHAPAHNLYEGLHTSMLLLYILSLIGVMFLYVTGPLYVPLPA